MQALGHFFGRQIFDVTKKERKTLATSQKIQAGFQVLAMFGPKHPLLGTLETATERGRWRVVDFCKRRAAGAPEKIDGRIRRDARQPMRGFFEIFELVLPLEGLDEGFLGQVLGVLDVAHDPINEEKHAAHVFRHEAALQIRRDWDRVKPSFGRFLHVRIPSDSSIGSHPAHHNGQITHNFLDEGDCPNVERYPEFSMRPVAIVGIGKTAFGAFPDRDLLSLAKEAGQKCLADANVSPSQIEAFYLGNFAGPSFVGQNHLAPYIGGALGLAGVPATRVEAACASSGSAFFHGVAAVAAGLHDVVLVGGVEKMTSQTTAKVAEILAGAGDMITEGSRGATFPALFAMIARRHMYQYGTTREQLAAVAVKNHANGAKNPLAHMRKVITMEQALNGKPISEPLTVFDCSLISDGAAAVLIVPLERAAEFTSKPVKVLGIAQTSDYVALDQKPDITTFQAVRKAAEKAYKMAGVTANDIEFAELHDCFTIAEIVASEDLGFVEKGQGGPYALHGCTALTGTRPINASGGLKAKGHPVGATGVAQICDVVQQIRGEAGERQVAKNSIGLAQNLGGSGATAVVTVMGKA